MVALTVQKVSQSLALVLYMQFLHMCMHIPQYIFKYECHFKIYLNYASNILRVCGK